MITAWAMFSGEPKIRPARNRPRAGHPRWARQVLGPGRFRVDDFHRLGRFAGPRGQAADFAAECLPDVLRELLVGLRDFAAKFLAAAAELARVHVLLHLLAHPAADRRIFIGNDFGRLRLLGRRRPAPPL